MLAVQVTHPSPIHLSRCCSSPALLACGQKGLCNTSQPSQAKPARLAETNYFNFSRLFGSFWLGWVWKQLHQQLGSRPVGEVGLISAKGWLQGAGGWPEASTSSAGPGAPGKGVKTPGESRWGSPVWTNYFTGSQKIISWKPLLDIVNLTDSDKRPELKFSVFNNQTSEPANSLLLKLLTRAHTYRHIFSLFFLCLTPWAVVADLRQGRLSAIFSAITLTCSETYL